MARIPNPVVPKIKDQRQARFSGQAGGGQVRRVRRSGRINQVARGFPQRGERLPEGGTNPPDLVVGHENPLAKRGQALPHGFAGHAHGGARAEKAGGVPRSGPANRHARLLDLPKQAVVVGEIAMRAAGNDRRFPAVSGQVFKEFGGPLDPAQAHGRKIIRKDKRPPRWPWGQGRFGRKCRDSRSVHAMRCACGSCERLRDFSGSEALIGVKRRAE